MMLSTMQALRFLLSPRSLAGLLAANLVTLIPFVCGVMYVPFFDAGMDVGVGIIQPASIQSLQSMTMFGVMASLLGTLLLAIPVICYLQAKGKTDYSDYMLALLKWTLLLCLLMAAVIVLLTQEINTIMLAFFIFPVIWIPAWLACVTYWRIAIKEPIHNFKTSTKIMFVLTLLVWVFMSMNYGAFMATD